MKLPIQKKYYPLIDKHTAENDYWLTTDYRQWLLSHSNAVPHIHNECCMIYHFLLKSMKHKELGFSYKNILFSVTVHLGLQPCQWQGTKELFTIWNPYSSGQRTDWWWSHVAHWWWTRRLWKYTALLVGGILSTDVYRNEA